MPTLTPDDVRTTLLKRTIDRKKLQRTRPRIRIWDKDWNLQTELLGEIEATFEEKLNDTGQGILKLPGKHKIKDWLINQLNQVEDVHITVDVPGKRWAGKASTIEYFSTDKGFDYLTLTFLNDYEHVKKIICYSNPLLPPEFQFPKIFIWAGPAIFGIKTLIFLNLMRRFFSLWALPDNIFDPVSWFTNLDPNNWSIVCMPGDFFSDTSAWCVLTTRFGNLHDVVGSTLNDAGLQITTQRWLPGDPQPASGHMHLTRPTLVLDVVDKSGVVGPTGTVFDGILKTLNIIAQDGVTETQAETSWGEPPPQYSQPGFFGTVSNNPWVCWRSGMKTGLTGISMWQMVIHKALAGAVVTGGKSPAWVNAGIKLLMNAVLGYIGLLFGNPALGLGIFDSEVEDVILAFHRVANPIRQAQMGRDLYSEHWETLTGTGFSLSALQAIRVGMWNTRAYTAFKLSVINGAPYWVGRHFDLGDLVSAEIGDTGRLYVDQVYGLKLSWSRTQDPRWEIQIGSGKQQQMPGQMLSDQVTQIRSLIQGLGVS